MRGIGAPIQSFQDKAVLREYAHALRDNPDKAERIYAANTDLIGSLNVVKELHQKEDWEAFNRFL